MSKKDYQKIELRKGHAQILNFGEIFTVMFNVQY